MKLLVSLLCFPILIAGGQAATNPPMPAVTLTDSKLVGEFHGDQASFTFTAIARVENAKGGSLDLLSGPVALTEITTHPHWLFFLTRALTATFTSCSNIMNGGT